MELDKKDLKVTFSSGTGPGGQHRNKVQACCTILHIPTGIKEKCEESRSKHTNYETALKRVTERVKQLYVDKKKEELNNRRKEALDESNGSKVIRTYNYQRGEVKDHRSGKVAPLKKVINGDIDLLK